jgi:hypothetical protein
MNKTIINQNKGQIRKRNESRNLEYETISNSKKIYKTPAVVLEVVQIVNQKKAYHRLRNMGMEKKKCFRVRYQCKFFSIFRMSLHSSRKNMAMPSLEKKANDFYILLIK